jgi:hypothetical protein
MSSAAAACHDWTEWRLTLPQRSFFGSSNGITEFEPTVAHIKAAFATPLTTRNPMVRPTWVGGTSLVQECEQGARFGQLIKK